MSEKKKEFMEIKDVVEEVLSDYARARVDDHFLIFKTLQNLDLLEFNVERDKIEIQREDMNKLPSFETITRARRKLQSEGLYEAPEEVDEKREIYRTEMREVVTDAA